MTTVPHLRLCITALLVAGLVHFSCADLSSFSDTHGNTYTTVEIGGQTWMANNLRFDVGDGSYCYNDDPVMCNEMGRLYTWEAAVGAAGEIDGWHLPSKQEWQELVSFCGEDSAAAYLNLISDTIGFNPEWSGVRVSTGAFKAAGLQSANYWSSSLSDTSSTLAYSVAVMSGFQMISPHNYPIANACSVRLIRDR
jgi:uncharacterized protein (TIGR02145 family)